MRYSKKKMERYSRLSVESFLKGNRAIGRKYQKKAEKVYLAKKGF
jgi:hypothetical protein